MRRKTTVAEANLLLNTMHDGNILSIEEELNGRLARLLYISGDQVGLSEGSFSGEEELSEDVDDDGK